MKQIKEPFGARVIGAIGVMFFEIVGQILLTAILIGYFLLCFWFFDHLHISNSDTQLAWVLTPLMLGGLTIVIRMIRKNRGS